MRVSNGRRNGVGSDERKGTRDPFLDYKEEQVVERVEETGSQTQNRGTGRRLGIPDDIDEIDNKGIGGKNSKDKKKAAIGKELDNLSGGRKFRMALVGILSCLLIAVVVWGLYYNMIRYPDSAEYNVEESGLGAIEKWETAIKTLDNDTIKGVIGEDSYLAKEVEYANEKEYQLNFINKVMGTVKYTPNKVESIDRYGNVRVDESGKPVYTDSLVNGKNEKVTLTYIDYSKIQIDNDKVKEFMKGADLSLGDVDYSSRLVEVFCNYIVSLEGDELPLVSIKHKPNLVKADNGYSMSSDEDIFLDKELFSSEAFYGLLQRFSLAAGSGAENPEWVAWNKLSKKEKKKKKEPEKTLSELQPSSEWTKWSKLSEKDKAKTDEPEKYDPLNLISDSWCGAYYLLNENAEVDSRGNKIKRPVTAEIGDGTKKNPAGLNTNVITSIFVNENGKRVEKPIRVRLIESKLSQDAIDYFEGKDERNRGFDIKSEIQYIAYSFEVTNLSDSEITIYDDSSLCDESANMSHKTGIIYGLQSEVKLKPNETGIIESWGCSTELNKKYLVWGSNFKRQEDVVWFRVLAGDIDDPSEDKGVTLNKTREDQ